MTAARTLQATAGQAAWTGFAPVRMIEIELTEPLPALRADGRYRRALVLARLHGEPIGAKLIDLADQSFGSDEVAALIWPMVRHEVAIRFTAAGLAQPAGLSGSGLAKPDAAGWPFLLHRSQALRTAPFISVVICTRNRPQQLANCLSFVAAQDYPSFEVVVVDNSPGDDAVMSLVRAGSGGPACRYVMEPTAGLSRARNTGAAAATADIIAFLDDDEEPDRSWLAGIAGGFARGADIGCVTGLVVPARLETEAQELFEVLGGHSKGRGYAAAVFSRHDRQSPLYPLPPFGAGANMAFRRDVLRRIGGFDVALGAGTPAMAGEDTLALTLVLLAGYRIAYEPSALMRHDHRPDLSGLERQLRGYGTGLTAYYAALLRRRLRTLPALIRLLPAVPGYLRSARSVAREEGTAELVSYLIRRQRRGMLTGPLAYCRGLGAGQGRQAEAGLSPGGQRGTGREEEDEA